MLGGTGLAIAIAVACWQVGGLALAGRRREALMAGLVWGAGLALMVILVATPRPPNPLVWLNRLFGPLTLWLRGA